MPPEQDIERAIADACARAVGVLTLRQVLRLVRQEMFRVAFAACGSNRARAASVLGVTRQAVQAMVRSHPACPDPAPSPSSAD